VPHLWERRFFLRNIKGLSFFCSLFCRVFTVALFKKAPVACLAKALSIKRAGRASAQGRKQFKIREKKRDMIQNQG
jgi:hypothetical protein